MNALSQRFINTRKELRLTRKTFAIMLGVDTSTLLRAEKGKIGPKCLKKAAAYYKISISEALREYNEQL